MIYNDNLAENNQKLTEILNLVNKLPEVGYRIDDFIIRDGNSIQSLSSEVNSIRPYICYQMSELVSINFPNLLKVREGAFLDCSKLAKISLPNTTHLEYYSLKRTYALKSVYLPKLESIAPEAFNGSSIEKIKTNSLRHVYREAFIGAASLTTLIIDKNSTLAEVDSSNAFSGTPIEAGTGYIYVPQSLIEQYKTALNWSVYANQFRAIEDYPEVCN